MTFAAFVDGYHADGGCRSSSHGLGEVAIRGGRLAEFQAQRSLGDPQHNAIDPAGAAVQAVLDAQDTCHVCASRATRSTSTDSYRTPEHLAPFRWGSTAVTTHAGRLLIDVRGNPGGSDVIVPILVGAFCGFAEAIRSHPAYALQRLSPLLPARIRAIWPDSPGPLDGGIRFTERDQVERDLDAGAARNEWVDLLDRCPSVAEQRRRRGNGPWWQPDKLLLLCDAATYSAGYSIVRQFARADATIIGSPSGQSGNAYGDSLEVTLPRSGGRLRVSYQQFRAWADDPDRGHLLHPDIEITYNQFAANRFDPNAAILLALSA